MKYLLDQHRELLNKINLLGSGLLVYMAVPEAPTAPVAPKPATEAAVKPPETPDQVKTEMEAARTKLEAKYKSADGLSPAEDRALNKFKDLIDKTTETYKKELDNAPNPEKKAAEAMMKPVNDLIAQINAREKSGSAETATLNEGADPKNAEKMRLIGVAKVKMTQSMMDIFGGAALAKLIDPKAEQVEKNPSAEDLLKNTGFNDYMTEVLMRYPEADLKEIEAGKNPKLTKESLKAAMDGVRASVGYEKLSDPDDKEKDLVKTLRMGEETFDKVLGADSPIPELISRLHDVEGDKDGTIKIDGKTIKNIADLGQFLPPSMREGFEKVAKEGSSEEDKKNLNSSTTIENGRYEGLQKGIKSLEQGFGKMIEGGGKMGSIEAIGVFIQMYGMLKVGDFDSLIEAMEDFNKGGESPMKIMKKCSDEYKKVLDDKVKTTSASDLLDAYLEPRETAANKLFGAPNGVPPLGRYRGAICEPIAKQFESQLGISHIDKITRESGHAIIDSGGVAYHIYKSGEKLVLLEGTIKETTDKDGKVTATSHPKPSGEPKVLGDKDVTLTQIKEGFDAKAKVESERVALENTKNSYKGVIDKLEPRDKTTLLNTMGGKKFEGKLDDKYPKLDSKIKKPTEEQQQALNQERTKYIVANFNKYKPVLDGRDEFKDLQPKKEEPASTPAQVASAEKAPAVPKEEAKK